jgi:triphosphatase
MEALHSKTASVLFLSFNNWLRCGDYIHGHASDKNLPIVEFAGAALDRMRKKLKRHGRDLAAAVDEHRHEARKDAKKFRYAAEFFSSLSRDKASARRYKRFIATMEELQDRLGALNDLATGHLVLEKLGLGDDLGARKLLSQNSKSEMVAKAQAALDEVTDLKRFWRI